MQIQKLEQKQNKKQKKAKREEHWINVIEKLLK